MIDFYKIKTTVWNACQKAGKFQLENFNQKIETHRKESISSVVTFVDVNSENLIVKTLKETFPDFNILSEEMGFEDNHSEYTWVIDPLDGTSNYAAGLPWFGVLLALVEGNNPIVGAAFLPHEQKFYYAEKGMGASLNSECIQMNDMDLNQSLFAFSTDYCMDANYLNYGLGLYRYVVQNSRNVRSTNSLLDLLGVAENKFGGCVNLFTKIWDIAGPALIIQEAGGAITNLDGSALRFEISADSIGLNYGILAGNSTILNELRTSTSFGLNDCNTQF